MISVVFFFRYTTGKLEEPAGTNGVLALVLGGVTEWNVHSHTHGHTNTRATTTTGCDHPVLLSEKYKDRLLAVARE